jgi:hypothetical protein
MIDFLKRLFGQSGSSTTAKERLRLVLMTDHLELSPELIEAMKRSKSTSNGKTAHWRCWQTFRFFP